MPMLDRDTDDFVAYYPTIRHGMLSGGNLNTEYKQIKGLKEGYGKNKARATKTAAKLKEKLDNNRQIDNIIIVSHGSDDSTIVGGGSWIYTPTHEAAAIAQTFLNEVTATTLSNKKIWLWICYSAPSGVAAAFKAVLGAVPGIRIYGATGAIAGLAFWMKEDPTSITNRSFILV